MPMFHVEQVGGRGSCFTWNRIGGQEPPVLLMFHLKQRASGSLTTRRCAADRFRRRTPGAVFHVKPKPCSP